MKHKNPTDFTKRREAEAAFLLWWGVERKSDKFNMIPSIGLVYLEATARKAWMVAKGIEA